MLVSTSTLAYGVNLPADVGIIVGGHRGPSMVEPWDIKQMAGRIGRYGLSATGDVYYLFKDVYADELYQELTDMPDVRSQLAARLYFHITSFVARESMQRPQIERFLAKTLCALQKPIHIEEAIDMLLQYEILREYDGQLSPSSVGRASAYMYVDPIDLHYMVQNLREKPLTPGLVAQALADIPSYEVETYVPDDFSHKIEMPYGQQTIIASSLYEWLTGMELSPTASVIVPPFVMDFERWASALGMCGISKDYIKNLSLTIQYGISENLLDLVKIPGIGRKRAISLYNHGITKKSQITENLQLSYNILGKKLTQSIVDEQKNPGKIFIRY